MCLFFVEIRCCYVVQTGLKLLGLSNPSTSASQIAEITGVSHCVYSEIYFFFEMESCSVAQDRVQWCDLTATSASHVQVILLPQSPE